MFCNQENAISFDTLVYTALNLEEHRPEVGKKFLLTKFMYMKYVCTNQEFSVNSVDCKSVD